MNRFRIALLLVLLAGSLSAQVERGGVLPGPLPLFPSDNWWNADISQAPIDLNSASFLSYINNGGNRALKPDMGGESGLVFPESLVWGMIYITVPGTQPLVPVTFDYWEDSDPGAPGRPPGYPIPAEAATDPRWIEGGHPGNSGAGGDRHMLIVDRDNRLLYETWATRFNTVTGQWEAGSGAVFSLDSNARRPRTWTSADAAGLAILPGLIRYDEVYGTEPIRHALRFTTRSTNGYVYPASHRAGTTSGAPPLGMRMRLKSTFDISGYSPPLQRIFQAMKTYGLIDADNGSDMYIQGTYDTRWDMGLMNSQFATLHANDFEVIQLGYFPDFLDVPPAYAFHDQVVILAKNGVTLGCGTRLYCPNAGVVRSSMAAFLARAMTGGDALVPYDGTVGSSAYSCTTGGTSLFNDVSAENSFCRFIHYIASQGVTLGCGGSSYCPATGVRRDQMAMFVARAVAGSDAAVPSSYTDGTTGRSYNLGAGQVHFTDMGGNIASRHAHYLWARGFIDGCTGTTYCPSPIVTRGQMAKFLANAFALTDY